VTHVSRARTIRFNGQSMHQIFAMLLFAVALFAPVRAVAGERMLDLFRQGYQIIYTEPYLAFEACEYDKPIKVGSYIFMCRTYEYVYHYGKAELMGQTLTISSQSVSSVYLCVGEDHCLSGALYSR
jgi:hypothetical protein